MTPLRRDFLPAELDDVAPYLDVAFEALGPERLMIGSDWPVCTVATATAVPWGR